MTTFEQQSVVCGACGCVFTHKTWAMTSSCGSPALDTRPPEMDCMMLETCIQRCPSCGYCSSNATKFDEWLRAVMGGSAYRSQLADPHYPALASTFICAGLLAEASDQRHAAASANLRAAWVLDDEGKDKLARVCRSRAADTFLALLSAGHPFAAQPGVSEAIVTDCLRRAGRGAEALQVIERALGQSYDDIIRRILQFQRMLVQRGDTGSHLISEALETKETTA